MNPNLKIFIGYDSREKIAFHVLSHSIITKATIPVSITPINFDGKLDILDKDNDKKKNDEYAGQHKERICTSS